MLLRLHVSMGLHVSIGPMGLHKSMRLHVTTDFNYLMRLNVSMDLHVSIGPNISYGTACVCETLICF